MKQKLDVCLSLNLIDLFDLKDSIVVIIDVLRATSAICEAFKNGAKEIIPVSDLAEARNYKEQGFIVAAERDGKVLDFADFGNSPHNFTAEKVKNKSIVYSTINGVPALQKTNNARKVIIASFLNIDVIVKYLSECKQDIVLLCAGWKGDFNLEDTILAGAISQKLLDKKIINTSSDSVRASIDLWRIYKPQLIWKANSFEQIKRLRGLEVNDETKEYFSLNTCTVIPHYENGRVSDLNSPV